ncbi:DUF1612 domain-containing protein [Agrobacterium vitis]|uniref:DUF1612 domain-containing protein n=1 Tax=Agrobacterium vitis TaxID=373 RepID=A0A6L6VJN3_AGRVI|nr:RHE_PE00001 family protein [Agrobacterium vitis]MUZ74479.1 DUF1612 domain-containing protein [Agrobacterium vitis]
MPYDLSKFPLSSLSVPNSQAISGLVRLDERVARSAVGAGFLERMHFADACASLWLDGELVHLEDLVLHDAHADVRTPTHELTIASDVLRTRRRIAAQRPGWALSPDGLRILRGRARDVTAKPVASDNSDFALGAPAAEVSEPTGEGEGADDLDPLAKEMAAVNIVLARSNAAIERARMPGPARARELDSLVYDLDWDENERLDEWRLALTETEGLPPVLRAMIALDAWNELQVLQRAPWLGRLLAASLLRQAGLTTAAHLAAFNFGLKSVAVERRRHRDREVRLLAIAQGLIMAAEIGLKEHDRLALARQMMERKLAGRRTSSRLADLIDVVIARPLVSAGVVAKMLDVKPQSALRIVRELGLREMTGRGRYRAWGVL